MAKIDPAHKATDDLIAKYERRLKREYKQAQKELEAKFNDYCKRFQAKYDIKLKQVADGTLSKADFDCWVKGQLFIGTRWNGMRYSMAEDLLTVDQKARSMALGYQAEAYAINHDYATFMVEKGAMVDTSYTLYDRHTVERLAQNKKILPDPGDLVKGEISRGEAIKWRQGQIQSVVMQSILQGESIQKAAKRISENLSTRSASAAVRYARTAMTGAQNAGRVDGFKRAVDLGIKVKQQWVATPDDRTRQSHRDLDGEIVEVGEKFSNGLEYPGDPNGSPQEVWNCRCTLVAALDGMGNDVSNLDERFSRLEEGQTYDEWKAQKTGRAKRKPG